MFNPTEEQRAIIEFGKSSKQSLLINALAGAAKTSTLVMLAHALPPVPILSLAFNKRIAEEMQKRMPGHVQCLTLNSAGHRAWGRVTGKKLILNTSKSYDLIKGEIAALSGKQKSEASELIGGFIRAISAAKMAGWVPKSYRGIADTLIDDCDLEEILAQTMDTEPDQMVMRIVTNVIETSIKSAYQGGIDFDDQVYMSTLFGKQFPKYPTIMGDEVQDWSPLNHRMVEVMKPDRLIAVGDPWQSIYAFRGADRYSMQKLKSTFNMEERTLSISFRCPITAVKRAHFRVPHMKWWETAIEGEITRFQKWSPSDVPQDTSIICRNNAPLFVCAIAFIKAGIGVQLVGRELGPGLIKILNKLGPPDMSQENLRIAINAWRDDAISKAHEARKGAIYDKAECLQVFADFGKTLAEAIAYAEILFASDGTIKLMTGHKAKGLEFETILFLDAWMIPSKFAIAAEATGNKGPMDQELNLKYVIETRWKQRMILANLEDLV